MTWDVHPGSGSRIRILIFTHPGSVGQKDSRSRIWIRNTVFLYQVFFLYKPCEIQAEYVHEVVDAAGAPHCVQATPLVHHNCLQVK